MRYMRGCFFDVCPLLKPQLDIILKDHESRVDVFETAMVMISISFMQSQQNGGGGNVVFSPEDAWKWLIKVINWFKKQSSVPLYVTQAVCIIVTGAAGATAAQKDEIQRKYLIYYLF